MISNPFKTLALSAALAVSAGGAMAQQTAPNTVVTNTIDLSYNSGGASATVIEPEAASVVFNVDRKIDLGVIAQAGGGQVTAVPGDAEVVLSFEVENRGNDTQGFVITVGDSGNIDPAGLTYSETATTEPGEYYVMISDDGVFANGDVYNVNAGPNAGNLDPDESYYVLIVANVPIGATSAQFDDFIVTATATDAGTTDTVNEDRSQGLTGVNTVFADAASNSTRTNDPIDDPTDGKDADETRLLIQAPVLTATKEAAVVAENIPGEANYDCANGGTAISGAAAAIPGACVEYTITITNAAAPAIAATGISVTDVIPANTTYAGASEVNFDTINFDSGTNTVTAELGTLDTDTSASFTIRVLVD